ncbi:MAG: DJ-1/PfpI family protein [Clostridiales bacterium]|nr:DJ-1/PfpI family protein [Clostridiales bacterium]
MVYVFLANGFEEMEAVVPIDCLRRCELDVVTVGVGDNIIRGSHGITVVTDITDSELELSDNIDMIILPGGMPGTLNLEKSDKVQEAIDYCVKNNKYIAAICAAPSILGHKGLLNGEEAVCYYGFEGQLTGAKVIGDSVCVSNKFITARGAGVALEFSLKLAEILTSREERETLESSLACYKLKNE